MTKCRKGKGQPMLMWREPPFDKLRAGVGLSGPGESQAASSGTPALENKCFYINRRRPNARAFSPARREVSLPTLFPNPTSLASDRNIRFPESENPSRVLHRARCSYILDT